MRNEVMAALQTVELSREELENVVGVAGGSDSVSAAAKEPWQLPSAGWVCTISGECNSSGNSCNPF